MKAKILSESIDKTHSDTLVLSFFKDERPLRGANGLIDWRLCGRVSRLIMDNVITGEFKETALIVTDQKNVASKILLVGLGKSEEFDEERLNETAYFIAHTLKNININKVALAIPGSSYFPQDYTRSAEIMITAFADSYEKKINFLEMLIYETGKRISKVYEGAKRAKSSLKNKLLLTLDA